MTEPYCQDLAYIHDVGFGDFATTSAPDLLKLVAESHESTRLVVDLGCGSGLWAKALFDAGYEVFGVDLSTAMVEIARSRVPAGRFEVGSFVETTIPRCRAVTALGEVFNYLFDPSNSLATLQKVCETVFSSLAPQGLLIFDVAGPGRCRGLHQRFWEGNDWTCLVEYSHEETRQQLRRRIITFRKTGETYRRHEEIHLQQLFDPNVIDTMLRNIGFHVETAAGYGATRFSDGVTGFIARKPDQNAAIGNGSSSPMP